MLDQFKGELIEAVKAATEVLTDEEALAIVDICKQATNREIVNISEQCLADLIAGSDAE